MALVVRAEPVLDRLVGQVLQPRIERRRHGQAVFVERLRPVLTLEVLAHFLHEERGDAGRLIGLPARDDWLLLGFVGPRLRDVVLVRHPLEHDVAAGHRPLHVHERTLPLGRLENAGDERRFLEAELLVRLVEVQAGRSLDAVGPVPHVHLVAVDREDVFLRVALLDLDRQDDLANLALEEFLLGQAELIEVARDLLRQRARALIAAPFDDVDEGGDENAPDVHADVAFELRVFRRDDGLLQRRVDVVVADDDAALGGELADDFALRRIEARNGARRVVVERGHLREVARVREENAAQNAEQCRHHEQRRDGGVACEADDVVRHGGQVYQKRSGRSGRSGR